MVFPITSKVSFNEYWNIIFLYFRRMSFWQNMPVYWNADKKNYKPAPAAAKVMKSDEL